MAPRPLALVPLLLLMLAMVALRCWVAGNMDFETDEAYYWLWSRHLAASYFDHPPMVAYFIRLGTWLFGDTILGVRSMAIVAMILASVLVYALAVILFGERRLGLLAVLWFNMMPHTAFFSIIMYPDTPAILFWVLSCVGLALVWKSGRGEWWYAVGVAMGLLLLSKYTGIFLLLGIAAWLLVWPEMRIWLTRREPYIAGAAALILVSPVIFWNAQHHWASFAKQFGRALETSSDGGLANVGAFVGIQAAFVSPLIFVFAIAGLGVAVWRGLHWQKPNWGLLALAAAPMLLYFLVHALSAEVLPQWPSAAYPTAVIAAVAAFSAPLKGYRYRPLLRYCFEAAPWVGLVFTSVMCAQMALRPAFVSAAHDPLSRFYGWAELASQTRAVADARHAGYIATSDYGTDATLAFYLRDIPVFQISEAVRYVFMPPPDQALLGRTNGIYIMGPEVDDLVEVQKHFESVEPISTIWRARDGDPIEPYRIYELKGYRGGLPY
jgi:4-amino-4-deoxy-L-arabinose transferase-like glycosyltransferase